jgi:hypothetical protein
LQWQERVLLQGLVLAQKRGLLRQPERRLLRCEGRAQFWRQVQRREPALLRCHWRGLVRGPFIGPEQGHERSLRPAPWQRLLRVHERAQHRGQGLPQPSRGREKLGQCRSQNADTRSQNSRKEKGLEHSMGTKSEARCQMAEVRSAVNGMPRSHVAFGGCGFSNTGERSRTANQKPDYGRDRTLPEM